MANLTVRTAFQLQQQERPQGGPRTTRDALEDCTGGPCEGYPIAEPETSMSMPSVSRTVLAPYKCPVPGYSGPLGCKGTLGMKRKMQDLYYSYRPSHLHDDDTLNDDDGEVNGAAPSKQRCCGEPSDATTVAGGFSIAGASAFRLEFEDGDGDDHAAASPMAATATSIRRLAPVTVPPLSRGRGAQVIPQIRRCSKIVRASGPDASAADTAKLGVPGSGGHDASKQSIVAKVAAASMVPVAAPLSTPKVAAAAVPTGRFDAPLAGAGTTLNHVFPTEGAQAMAATLPVQFSPLGELPSSAMLTVPQPPVVVGSPSSKAEEPMATGLREMEDFLTSLMRAAPPLQTPTVPTEPVVLDGKPNVFPPAPAPLDVSDAPPGVIAAALCSDSSISARGPAGLVTAHGSSQLPATVDCTHIPTPAMLLTKGHELPAPAVFNPPSAVKYTITPMVQTAEKLGLNPSISPRPGRGSPEGPALQLDQAESVLLLGTPSHRPGDGGDYSYKRGADDGLPDGASQAPVVVLSWPPTGVITGSMKPSEQRTSTDPLPLVVATDCNLMVAVPDGGPGSSLDLTGGFAPSNSPHGQCAPPALATSTAAAFAAAISAVAYVRDEAETVLLCSAGPMDAYEGAANCANGSTEPRQEDHPCAETFHAAVATAAAAAATVAASLPDLAASVAVTPAAVASSAAAGNLPAAGAVMDNMVITLMADPITSCDAAVSANRPGSEVAADSYSMCQLCAVAAEQPTGVGIGMPAAGGDVNAADGAAPALATKIGPISEAVDALTRIGLGSGDTPSPAQLLLHGLDEGGDVIVFAGIDGGEQDVIMAKMSGDGEAGQQDGDRSTISKIRTNVLAVDRNGVGDNGERAMEPWEPPAILTAVDALAAAAVEGTVAFGQSNIAAEAGAVQGMVEEPHSAVLTHLPLRQSPQLVSLPAASLSLLEPTHLVTGADGFAATVGDALCTMVLEAAAPACDPAVACVFPATAVTTAAAVMPDSNGNKQGTEVTADPERILIPEVLVASEAVATAAIAAGDLLMSRPDAGAPPVSDFPSGCLQTSKVGGQGAKRDGSLEFATLDSGSGGGGSPAAMSAEAQLEAAVMAALSGM